MTSHRFSISAIIPVYNEEQTIGAVVQTVINSNLFEEIICIDDGSKDMSLGILQSFGKNIDILHFDENKGKGAALAAGILRATQEIVVFLDADLVGLTFEHLYALATPLLEQRAEVTLGIGQVASHFPLLTGERAYFRKDLLPLIPAISKKRYGVEVFLNYTFKDRRVEFVHLDGLDQILKPQKMGINSRMISSYVMEGFQVSKELSLQTLNMGKERLLSIVDPMDRIKVISNKGLNILSKSVEDRRSQGGKLLNTCLRQIRRFTSL